MIRPLEYCITASHISSSIETINTRLMELESLREKYIAKKLEFEQQDGLVNPNRPASPQNNIREERYIS